MWLFELFAIYAKAAGLLLVAIGAALAVVSSLALPVARPWRLIFPLAGIGGAAMLVFWGLLILFGK